ncbi:hypothetical protein EST38_g6053 [Candolleomyces aberdarensis]|uniref:Cytochrome P450 n=1 Tax=Candolleomyces aberdarensis TaxID=2316362 RepID=A0A4Q2DKW0_9AGAR|nr:hypothetical protein EST38_g6053 [Candolleomyces aberdarensis]
MVMMPSIHHAVVTGLSILSAYGLSLYLKKRAKHAPYPPGPKGYPIINNLLQIPKYHPWLAYADMAKQYGDMIFLRAFGQPILVLCSSKRINDLMDKRSSIYSGRPYSTMMNELLDWGNIFSIIDSNKRRWKRQRRMFHQTFNASVLPEYHHMIRRHVNRYLVHMLSSSSEFISHTHHALGGIIMNITYGFDAKSKEDPYIAESLKVSYAFKVSALPGAFLVDNIPLLKYVPAWFPGAGFKRFAKYYRNATYNSQYMPFNFAMDAMNRNEVQPCAVTKLVETFPDPADPDYGEIKEDLINALGLSYVAGVESTDALLSAFVLVMAIHPDIQKKAQAELDRVVGPDRLPDFDDKDDLVYLKALITELVRWQQVTPLAIPHKTTEDDYYDGYFIPKGTLVLGNAWAVLHDPELFETPMEYNPERYIKDGKFDDNLLNPLDFAFGFGRR